MLSIENWRAAAHRFSNSSAPKRVTGATPRPHARPLVSLSAGAALLVCAFDPGGTLPVITVYEPELPWWLDERMRSAGKVHPEATRTVAVPVYSYEAVG